MIETLGDSIRAYNHTFKAYWPYPDRIDIEESMLNLTPQIRCPCGNIMIVLSPVIGEDDRLIECRRCKSWHTVLWR